MDVRLTSKTTPIVLKTGGEPTADAENAEEIRAKEILSRLYKGVNKILIQQHRDRHRLSLHSETNIFSHRKVVNGSIFETIVFIGAAIFQIFFVRRWFASRNSIAGKQRA